MRGEDGEERSVRVVRVAGVFEEAGLLPLASADVGLGRQLADQPAVRRVNSDGLLVDVAALDESLVATLGQAAEVMIDVMFVVPVVPMQMLILCWFSGNWTWSSGDLAFGR